MMFSMKPEGSWKYTLFIWSLAFFSLGHNNSPTAFSSFGKSYTTRCQLVCIHHSPWKAFRFRFHLFSFKELKKKLALSGSALSAQYYEGCPLCHPHSTMLLVQFWTEKRDHKRDCLDILVSFKPLTDSIFFCICMLFIGLIHHGLLFVVKFANLLVIISLLIVVINYLFSHHSKKAWVFLSFPFSWITNLSTSLLTASSIISIHVLVWFFLFPMFDDALLWRW